VLFLPLFFLPVWSGAVFRQTVNQLALPRFYKVLTAMGLIPVAVL